MVEDLLALFYKALVIIMERFQLVDTLMNLYKKMLILNQNFEEGCLVIL